MDIDASYCKVRRKTELAIYFSASALRNKFPNLSLNLDLGVDFKSRLESIWGFGVGSGRFHLGSESNFSGVVCLFFKSVFNIIFWFFANEWKSVFVHVTVTVYIRSKTLLAWSCIRFIRIPNPPASQADLYGMLNFHEFPFRKNGRLEMEMKKNMFYLLFYNVFCVLCFCLWIVICGRPLLACVFKL